MSLWATDLARAYADARTELPDPVRAVWADAFRAAVPSGPRRRVLDVGCGTGRFTALLGEVFGCATIGIDASPAMLSERSTGATIQFIGADAALLPLRPGCIDLALLSMVYHLLAPPASAIAELHRVLIAGGWVLVRTPTRELLDGISFLPYFPGARAIDEARMPSRAALEAVAQREGFAVQSRRTVEQQFARSPADALARVRRRPFSVLRLIGDDAFAEGLARYEAHCRSAPDTPIVEALDLFVLRRR